LSTETETTVEETTEEDVQFISAEDLKPFLRQITVALMNIVNFIESTMRSLDEDLQKRNETSDDNED
tara:strand:+ start:3384 stop:3584 length:201 start_codon:yes stop_codon:yes gene_type:complete